MTKDVHVESQADVQAKVAEVYQAESRRVLATDASTTLKEARAD